MSNHQPGDTYRVQEPARGLQSCAQQEAWRSTEDEAARMHFGMRTHQEGGSPQEEVARRRLSPQLLDGPTLRKGTAAHDKRHDILGWHLRPRAAVRLPSSEGIATEDGDVVDLVGQEWRGRTRAMTQSWRAAWPRSDVWRAPQQPLPPHSAVSSSVTLPRSDWGE